MPSLITDYLGSKNAGLVCSLVMIGFGIASIGTSFLAKAVSTSKTECCFKNIVDKIMQTVRTSAAFFIHFLFCSF